MTYRPGGRNATKMHDASQYSGNFPESVDWRTNNAVTSIKDQVIHAILYIYVHSLLSNLCRVTVELAMLSVPWVLLREPMLWLLVPSPLSVNRISLTAQVGIHKRMFTIHKRVLLYFPYSSLW